VFFKCPTNETYLFGYGGSVIEHANMMFHASDYSFQKKTTFGLKKNYPRFQNLSPFISYHEPSDSLVKGICRYLGGTGKEYRVWTRSLTTHSHWSNPKGVVGLIR
jgi:hypothetical protein